MSKKNKVILALPAVAAVLFCVLQFVILPPKLAAQDAFHQNHAITQHRRPVPEPASGTAEADL